MKTAANYDLFISYSRRDNAGGRISELVEHISRAFEAFAGRPLNVFFDVSSIESMQDWRDRILQGLRQSHLMVACISPDYLESKNCEWEFNEYLKNEVARAVVGDGIAPIYFVEVAGWDDKDFEERRDAWIAELRRRQRVDLRPWFDEGEQALLDDAIANRMRALNEGIVERVRRRKSSADALGNVDAHHARFAGRRTDLRRLREHFVEPGKIGVLTAVQGLAGIGKTALAVEYAHAFAHEYGGGRWQVRCEGREDIRLAIASLAPALGLEFNTTERADPDLQFERIMAALRQLADAHQPHRCLLLLDNVDCPALLEPAKTQRIPDGDWLHVIATTRLSPEELSHRQRDRSFIAVDELPEEDALELIENYQPEREFRSEEEREAARAIVRMLGGFPLAVEIAAVYLGEFAGDVTCWGFMRMLAKEGPKGIDEAADRTAGGVLHGEKRVSATFAATFDRLTSAERLALNVASLLSPDQIALPWIRTLIAERFSDAGQDAEPGYPDPWKGIVRRLLGLRLLQATSVRDAAGQPLVVRMHRLLGGLVRQSLGGEAALLKKRLRAEADDRAQAFSDGWVDPAGRWEADALAAQFWNSVEDGGVDAISAGGWLAGALNRLGRGLEGQEILERCLKECERHPVEPIIHASSHQVLAVIECDLGQLHRAEVSVREAIRIIRASSGRANTALVRCYSTLCIVLRGLGRTAEGMDAIGIAIALHDSLGLPEDISYSMLLSNRATFALDLGRAVEARDLLLRTVAIQRHLGGEDFPNLIISLTNLARAQFDLRELVEARKHAEQALGHAERIHPGDHPAIADIVTQIAVIDRDEGRFDEAKSHLERGLRIRQSALPDDHPDLVESLTILSTAQRVLGELDDARVSARRALDLMLRLFPGGHPDLGGAYSNVGRVELDAGNDEKAREAFNEAFAAMEKAGRTESWEAASSLYHRGLAENGLGLYLEAAASFARCVDLRERVFGSEAQELAYPLALEARALLRIGRQEEAANIRNRARARFQAADTKLKHRENVALELAAVEVEIGDPKEAITLAEMALDALSGPGDAGHRSYVLNEASCVFRSAGKPQEALRLIQEALRASRAGGEDALTLAVRYHNLAALQQQVGANGEARDSIREAIRLRTGLMRPEHPDLGSAYEILGLALEEMGDLDGARKAMQTAIDILTVTPTPDLVLVAETRSYLARVQMKRGKLGEARTLQEQALASFREMKRPPPNSLAFTLNELCIILDRLGEPGDRRPLLEEAIKLREASGLGTPRDLAVNHHNLGLAHIAKGDRESARKSLRRSVEIKRQIGIRDASMAYTLRELGEVEDDRQRACDLIAESVEIFGRTLGSDHSETQRAVEALRKKEEDKDPGKSP